MKRTKKQIIALKVNRNERLDYLEHVDNIIKHLTMSDEKLKRLKDLRGNSCRYTLKQLKENINRILFNS